MSFFEDIAASLDRDGIESRVGGDTLFVPMTAALELQLVEIDPHLPAANVYIAAADVAEDDDDFEGGSEADLDPDDDADLADLVDDASDEASDGTDGGPQRG